jgi:multisubunit Na+/H+ antiporter MnhE subunit
MVFKTKYSKRNRAIISGFLVGLASIYLIAEHFNVELSELNSFMITTIVLFLLIVVLAAVAVVVFKVLGRLLRGKEDSNDDAGPTA